MNSQPVLYIVATPIGTLSDMSPRARDTLARVSFVACEDTRRTKELLHALAMPHVPLVSLHEHNESEKSQHLVERLLVSETRTAALVSDAGTPAISDPGALFVDACHEAGIRIENVPGPSSLVAAVAAAGFLQPRVLFSGFLPRTPKDQREEFRRWSAVAPCIAVCFESPNRIISTLQNAAVFFSAATRVCLSREISKKFEEHLRLPLNDLLKTLEDGHLIKGECIITFEVLSDANSLALVPKKDIAEAAEEALQALEQNPSLHLKELSRTLATQYELHPKDLYNAILARRRT
ncbi:MAG: 16S rRNA (cytidine(1402)-2'-O)-methyltransferase [Betaproteobacteria bacterium]|nr:16S rRNA (cytidine(1402)-2'-O)-methyltransferase [Betaproteobacteria bacterium]